MKNAVVLIALPALLTLAPARHAEAGSTDDVALGLAAFAVFNQLFWGHTVFHAPGPVHAAAPPVVYSPPPPVVYAPPPAVVYRPAPTLVYGRPAVVYAPPKVVYARPKVVYAPRVVHVVRPAPHRHGAWDHDRSHQGGRGKADHHRHGRHGKRHGDRDDD